MKIVLELIHNLTLLIALAVALEMLTRHLLRRRPVYHAAAGVLFGAVCIAGMLSPIHFDPGVIIDARSVVLALAGLFAGPVSAGIAAVMAAAYRAHLGGAGALVGILVIVEAAALGTVLHYLRRRSERWVSWPALLLLGVLVHGAMLALLLLLPEGKGWEVLRDIGPWVMVFYPLAFLLAARVFLEFHRRRSAETALRTSEAIQQAMVACSPLALFSVDTEGRVLTWNDSAERLFGYTAEEVIGEPLPIVPEDKREEFAALREQVREGESLIGREIVRCKKDGSRFDASLAAAPMHDADGTLIGIFAAMEDITPRKRAERALEEERQRLEFVIEGARLGTWVWNLHTQETVFNETWARMLGYTLEELAPTNLQTWQRLTHPEDLIRAERRLQRCIEGEEPDYACELRMRHKDGYWVWIWDRGRVMQRDEGGRPLWMFGTHTDISEFKQTQEQIRRREEYLRAILQTTMDGFWVVDKQGRITDVNEAFCGMTGYGREELLGMEIGRIDDCDSPEQIRERMHRLRERGSELFETCLRRKDGRNVPVEISASHLPQDGGSYVCFCRDLSERKSREDRIVLLGEMLDEAPAAITIHDTAGRFRYANRKTLSLHGYRSREEFLAVNLQELDVPESEALHGPRFREIEAKGEATFEVEHYRRDGSTFPLEVVAKRISWEGQPAVLSIATDITERIAAEQERQSLRDQLAQSQRLEAVGRLAGGVAHDFNNMLNVILGHAELLLADQPAESDLRSDLEEIHRAAERSADLTRQLLAFARRQTVAPKVLDLNETLENMLKMLQRLIGEDIDLRWLPGAQVDPVHIDPAQIDQILANLVVNARDAIEGVGRVTIETGRASFDEEYCRTHEDFVPGRYALLAVSDDGCGMDEQTRRQVFDPFFTTKGVGEGTGLGLATVYGIVRQNGGFINVYSEPGEGTTFRIYLPVRRGESERVEPAAWQTRQVRGAGQTVLLVEDEPAILDLTRRMLLRMGYEVIPAATPGEALQRGREHAGTIHLLITDVVMPEMDGRALARQLLSLYPQMHRLFMSGYTANVIAHHGVLDEGVHFIQKPFSQSELAEKISDIFDGEE